MNARIALIFTIAVSSGFSEAGEAPANFDALCVRNASTQSYVFAVEAPGAKRRVKKLASGERLCVRSEDLGRSGVVSVYETHEVLEGCSRLVPVGRTEDMIEYVDFDRCLWSSHRAAGTK